MNGRARFENCYRCLKVYENAVIFAYNKALPRMFDITDINGNKMKYLQWDLTHSYAAYLNKSKSILLTKRQRYADDGSLDHIILYNARWTMPSTDTIGNHVIISIHFAFPAKKFISSSVSMGKLMFITTFAVTFLSACGCPAVISFQMKVWCDRLYKQLSRKQCHTTRPWQCSIPYRLRNQRSVSHL